MRGYIHYGEDDYEVEAEVEHQNQPMPEAHFRAVCGIIKLAIVGAAAVGVVFLAGTGGLLFDAGIAFMYGFYRLMQDC